MDHDMYWGFSRFWWLIFPLFWMIFALAMGWSRHMRANRALDIIKSYADQGKDPPPDLVKSLQGGGGCGPYGWRYSPERRLQRGIVFGTLAVAICLLMFFDRGDNDHWHHHFGFLIPAVVFAALAFSNFLSLLFLPRGSLPPYDKDQR